MKAMKKPIALDFIRLHHTDMSVRDCLEFMGQKVNTDSMTQNKFYDFCQSLDKGIFLKTMESDGETQLAKWGDCIMKGVKGEFYPIDYDVFTETYDIVE
jgi:hypothetical protein